MLIFQEKILECLLSGHLLGSHVVTSPRMQGIDMRLPLFLMIMFLAAGRVFAAPPVVVLPQGVVAGVQESDVAIFRGIPFAGSTAAENRWRPPSPAPHWVGVHDGSRHGPICPQAGGPKSSNQGESKVVSWLNHFQMSEDCLNLSVYIPTLEAKSALPVMVWIHGGFARIGSGSRYDGSPLAARGVVVVTLNYRLDRLGLFAHPSLSAEQPDAMLGNYALMDVLAGLQWVQKNIAQFGGDPGNVTIFGQSSGGVAVTALLGSPESRGLFHRAIAQSGTMADLDNPRYLARDLPRAPSLESDGLAMGRALLPETDNATTEQLRALPWESLVAYTQSQPAGALVPIVDGRILTTEVARSFAEGKQMPVPLMIGSTSWEQSLFVKHALPLALILGPISAEEARAVYPGLNDKELVGQWLADMGFHAAPRWLANGNAVIGQPTWVYRFDHLSPAAVAAGQPGAAHSDDVPYLFDLLTQEREFSTEAEQQVREMMLDYWSQFARTGNPNTSGQPVWRAWQNDAQAPTQVLGQRPESHPGLMAATMEYHMARYSKLLQTPAGQRPTH